MKRSSQKSRVRQRSGKIAVVTALLLVPLIGVLACALDIGWIVMTKTQLRAATDSAALAGGTELLPGLGQNAYRTPAEIETLARLQALDYASKNKAGDQVSVYVDSDRDISLGTGRLDTATGIWEFDWDATPYNAVRVIGHRDVDASSNGDTPLPLFFAPVIGTNFSKLNVLSTAVILPASGIQIPPGSGLNSALSPFAFDVRRWRKYYRAQNYYNNVLHNVQSSINETIMDDGPGGDGTELFFEWVSPGQGGGNANNLILRQVFDDVYTVVDESLATPENIIVAADGTLETNIYPLNSTEGNFGTVDIGGLDNSTAVINRQIEFGPDENDLALHANNTIDPSWTSPICLQGDTGISAGIQNTIEDIIGQCRAVLLYDTVTNPGNNAEYCIVDMVGTRWMHVDFSGSDKVLVIQPCGLSDPAAIPDFDEDIGDDTTLFTPLILAQ